MNSRPSVELVCLAVDDEPAIRAYVRSILESEHFRTLEAESGEDALRVVHRLAGAVDLIVSDVVMPGEVNGLDLAHSVKLAFPQIPIILMSGYSGSRADDRSAFEFLPKPFRSADLLEVVHRIVPPRREQSERLTTPTPNL